MEDMKIKYAGDDSAFSENSLGFHEAKELKNLLVRFIKEYGKKPTEQSDQEWLKLRFMSEMPELSEADATALSLETVDSVHEYNKNLASLKEARKSGKTAEEWFAEKAQGASTGIAATGFVEQIHSLDDALNTANLSMRDAVMTQSGVISQNPSLNGFIAEQQQVNTFNLAAESSGSPYRAYVLSPEAGKTYNKNSFDVVIKDEGGKIVHQYQFKYGQDAKSTISYIKAGNYNNQILVVPAEQVEEVQAAFPGKTVVSQIGGTDKVSVASQPLTKRDVVEMQENMQQTGEVTQLDWTAYEPQTLAKYVGKKAAFAGVQAAALAAGFHIAAKLATDEPIDTEEVVTTALKTGADSGVKFAAAGAVKVASERNLIRLIPKGTPMGTIVNVVCVAVENVKILTRVAKGELTIGEALDLMGCNTVAMTFGLKWCAGGAGFGLLALGWIPVVGPVIGGVVGGVIGYMAGSKFGETVYQTAKKVADVAKSTVRKIWNTGKEIVTSVVDGLKSTLLGWL